MDLFNLFCSFLLVAAVAAVAGVEVDGEDELAWVGSRSKPYLFIFDK